jgi:hypothetical protein
MFKAPGKDAPGSVQLCQYACWVEGVTGAAVCDPAAVFGGRAVGSTSTPSEEHLRTSGAAAPEAHLHVTIRHARRCCDALRDGRVFLALIEKLVTKTSHEDGTIAHLERKKAPVGKEGSAHTAARTLVEALGRMSAVLGPPALPAVTDVYAGRFAAVGDILFRLFHHFVVRDRFAFFPNMMKWYCKVCAAYGEPGPQSLEDLSGGTTLLLALHNMSRGVPVELTTCFLHPGSDIQKIAANISFVHCLFDVHGVFCYFPSVAAYIAGPTGRPNNHFLFMQAFHVFQHFRQCTVRQITDRVAFADATIDRRPMEQRQTEPTAAFAARAECPKAPILPAPVHRDPTVASPKATHKGTSRAAAPHHGSTNPVALQVITNVDRHRSPLTSRRPSQKLRSCSASKTRPVEPPPKAVSGNGISSSSVFNDNQHSFKVAIACCVQPPGGKLALESFLVTVSATDIRMKTHPSAGVSPSAGGLVSFSIPLGSVERTKLCVGQAPAVVLYCGTPTPAAMPPYNDGRSCPSVTFFSATSVDAQALHAAIEATRQKDAPATGDQSTPGNMPGAITRRAKTPK